MNRLKQLMSYGFPSTLQGQLRILVFVVVFGSLFVSGAIFFTFIGDISKKQISKRALDIGHSLSVMPLIQDILEVGQDPGGRLQILAEGLRIKTGAHFIVIADKHSRRYSHPDPEKIGKAFVGGDEAQALESGLAYVSEATGTLGPSLRSIVPVIGKGGRIIGFISVGYLQTRVIKIVQGYQREPATLVFMLFVVVLLGASGITRFVKKQTLGLEPREISVLYLDRQAIFQSIQNGIIAIGEKSEIRLLNQAAMDFLKFDTSRSVIGQPVEEVFEESDFLSLLRDRGRITPEEVNIDGRPFLFSSVPVEYGGAVHGMVASFRPMEDFYRLRKELHHTRAFSEMLRVQAHEYSNKLHTLAGLLQMEAYSEAVELVTKESSGLQSLIELLGRAVPHPALAAIIMGKHNRALEMKVNFIFNPDSSLVDIPQDLDQERVVAILGNLLDNAIEAASLYPGRVPSVRLFMTDYGHDLIFEIEDSGQGISPALHEKIFTKGYSSKTEKKGLASLHGIGLFLVKQYVNELKGQIMVSAGELGGALFTVILPKHPKE